MTQIASFPLLGTQKTRFTSLIRQDVPAFFLGVWFLYLFLSPFYVLPKGLPQPADYILFIGILGMVLEAVLKGRFHINLVYIFGLLFAGLTIIVNLINMMFYFDQRFIFHSMYYVYNLMAFAYGLMLFKRNPELANFITFIALATAIIFQATYAPFFGEMDKLRNMGSFNNPNQLAYWGVLAFCMLITLKRERPYHIFDLMLFALLLYLQSLSLSKAGIITSIYLAIVFFFSPGMTNNIRLICLAALTLGIITQIIEPGKLQARLEQVEQVTSILNRIEAIGTEQDDTAEGRGYDRIVDQPHYILFGAGEGAHWRFSKFGQEMHSGLATILFSYGIAGFAFFALFLGSIFFRLPIFYVLLLLAPLMHGLTHQNIRFTHFWIFLSLVYAYHYFYDQKTLRKRSNQLDSAHDQRSVGPAKAE